MCEWEAVRDTACVSVTGLYHVSPTGVHVFILLLRCMLKSLDLFLIQNKLIGPPSLLYPSTKTNSVPPRRLNGMVLKPPHSSAYPVLGVLAALSECDEAALSGQHLLFRVTCQQRGRARWRGRGPPKEGWAGLWERIAVSAGWSGWMRVTTAAADGVCQELARANNVACGGAG